MNDDKIDLEIRLQDDKVLEDLASKIGKAIESSDFVSILTEFNALSKIEISIKFKKDWQKCTHDLQPNESNDPQPKKLLNFRSEVEASICCYREDNGVLVCYPC